jgi:ABC-2 type transport system permease protein
MPSMTRRRPNLDERAGSASSWLTDHAAMMATAWPMLLIAVFFPLARRGYQRRGR